MSLRTHSFVWGGLACALSIGIGIAVGVNTQDFSNILFFIVAGILLFTLISCIILCNNFVGGMVATVFRWGFVRMPGIIFELSLDGCLFLIGVKVLFWIISTLISLLFGALAIALGMVCSVFVYPFALYESFKDPLD
ncbi:MAG: hypothetical protein IJY71_04615 [Clostridia bacterium]|nr:hypothetical protein [Clostridia bacterium]